MIDDRLRQAIWEGDLGAVRDALAHGVDVNAADGQGWTVLMTAAASTERTAEMVRLLLDAGADARAVSAFGYNTLHAAVDVDCQGERPNADRIRDEIIRMLIEAGADLEAKNKRGLTPLARAVVDGYAEEAISLIRAGADATVRVWDRRGHVLMPQGGTLLMFRSYRDPSLIRALLEAGVDPFAQSEEGLTTIDYMRASLARARGTEREVVEACIAFVESAMAQRRAHRRGTAD